MKIENKRIARVQFKDVKPGQAFTWCECVYIKTESTAVLLKDIDGLASINAVGLSGGSYAKFNDGDEVIVCEDAKVVIE